MKHDWYLIIKTVEMFTKIDYGAMQKQKFKLPLIFEQKIEI